MTLIATIRNPDLAGNVTKATLDDGLTYPGDAVVTYAYDDLYRLTHEYCKPSGANSKRKEYGYRYWYDAVGNRTYAFALLRLLCG